MSRARRAADRIREDISLAAVLIAYKYDDVYDDGGDGREQQFRCDLHGDGSDNKPSARLYENQFFCFACGRSRDAIALVREKENVSFWEAIKKLEAMFGLEPLPWEDGDERTERPEQALKKGLEEALRPTESPDQALTRLDRFLDGLTKDRDLTPQRIAGFWEAHDRVEVYLIDGGDPDKAIAMSHQVLAAAKDALRGE